MRRRTMTISTLPLLLTQTGPWRTASWRTRSSGLVATRGSTCLRRREPWRCWRPRWTGRWRRSSGQLVVRADTGPRGGEEGWRDSAASWRRSGTKYDQCQLSPEYKYMLNILYYTIASFQLQHINTYVNTNTITLGSPYL